jgi:hypothetical protein
VERIARDQKLHALACAESRTYDDALACSILVQHKNFNWIAQVTVIKLIVADTMKSHGRIWGHHEIEGRPYWPAIKKWCREPTGRDSLIADECYARETARGLRLELEQRANLFGTQIIGHSSLNMEPPTSNVQYRIGHGQIKIERA